ncbi:hypothetical protein [Campylobacter troglodytis]|uniref:hypothetical protein n=1 Tax=Campylobacter troglodytis TaxID=654363 RepID=UPI00115C404A|nr:hypothetical protein [Campylobacter troglodytis]
MQTTKARGRLQKHCKTTRTCTKPRASTNSIQSLCCNLRVQVVKELKNSGFCFEFYFLLMQNTNPHKPLRKRRGFSCGIRNTENRKRKFTQKREFMDISLRSI